MVKIWQSLTGHRWPWYMGIACCIPKATNTHSEYVIFIAFPLLQWLHKHASLLHYTCISWLFLTVFIYYSSDNESSAAIMWSYLSGLWRTGLLPSTLADSYTVHHSVLNNHTTMPPFLAAIFSPVTSSASAFSLIHIKHNLITLSVVDMSTYFQQAWTVAHSSTQSNQHDGFAVNQWQKENPKSAKRCSLLHRLTSNACYATMSRHISD